MSMRQKIKNYKIHIEWSNEDNAYVATVPALNARGHGETASDAAREAHVAAEAIIEIMEEDKIALPTPDTKENRQL